MTGLAFASLRHRATASAATFVTILLGTALMASFATLLETASGPVADRDRETLVTMGAVVGGWGTLIVLFAVISTVGITVTQRETEIGLLRTLGATPSQARRLVRVETLVVAVVAATAGAGLAVVAGRGVLVLIRRGGLVADSVGHDGSPVSMVSPALTGLVVVLVSLLGSGIAGRRATRGVASISPSEGLVGALRLRWWRVVSAVALIGYGLAMGVLTVTVTANDSDPYAAMQTSGSCCILVGLGLAVLAPWLLRHLAPLMRPLLGAAGAAGYLAAYNTSRRSHLLGGVLAPVIVLSAAAVGTLMAVGADGRTLPATGFDEGTAEQVTLLNNVVVGMVVVFAAVVVLNSFAAVIAHRKAELHRLWLLGATRAQVEGSVLAEAGVVAAVGVVLGGGAALSTIVPFGIARHEGLVPDGQLWLPPLVLAAVVALTLLAALSAVRRTAPVDSPEASLGAVR